MVLARLDIVLAYLFGDDLLAGSQTEATQVDAVGTHVGDASALVEMLCHHHGLCYGKAQLVGCFLLESTGGEGRCRRALDRLCNNILNGEAAVLAALQEGTSLSICREATAEFCLDFAAVCILEDGCDAVVLFAAEVLYLAFTLHDEANGDALHAACREAWLDLAPEHGTEFEAHDAVQHSACLLCVDQVEVYLPRVLDGIQYGGLCDFVEDDAAGILRLEVKHFVEVPADGFSLAVFIGCQPHHRCYLCLFSQQGYHLQLVGRHFVLRFECLLIYAERLLLQVAYVSVAGQDLIFISQEFLDGFSLCGALYNNKILLH